MRLLVFLILLLIVPNVLAQTGGLRVRTLAPMAHSLTAARDTPITVTFEEPLDAGRFDAATVMVQGRWSGVMTGEVVLENGGRQIRFTPHRPFSAGEMVTVSLTRDLVGATGEALPNGYAWQFWIRTRPASLDLTETARLPVRTPQEQQQRAWIQTYGAYAGDLDADGYTDFIVPNERSNDLRVFMNDGDGGYGAFEIYAVPQGSRPSTNEGADFNGDGHLDFVVGNTQNDQIAVYRGDGTGHLLAPQTYTTAHGVRGLTVLDFDGDGFPDIATASRDAGQVTLLHNDGDGTFTITGTIRQAGASGIATADADHDGDFDLFVGSYTTGEIALLINDGTGRFSLAASVDTGGNPWMLAIGDVDGDGNVDVVSTNANANTASVVFVGDHGQILSLATYPTGNFSLAIDLGDLDGDGDLDMVTSSFQDASWTIFENEGAGTFVNPRTLSSTSAASCAVLHDRDNNGTLDLTGIDELDDLLFLFTNTPAPTQTEALPEDTPFTLLPGYPNPFSYRTNLSFRLDIPAPAHLAVYDLQGREIRTLLDSLLPAGLHTVVWNGLDNAGRPVAASFYLARLSSGKGHRAQVLHRITASQ